MFDISNTNNKTSYQQKSTIMKKTVNTRIKELRTHMSLTQQEFSTLVGMTNTHLSRVENGENVPHKSTIDQVIQKTGVNKDWLVNGIGELTISEVAKQEHSNCQTKDVLISHLKEQLAFMKEDYDKILNALLQIKTGKFKASFFATGRNNRSVKGANA